MDPPTPGGPTPGGETRTGSDLDADTVARAKRDALKEYIKNLKEEKNDASRAASLSAYQSYLPSLRTYVSAITHLEPCPSLGGRDEAS